MTRRKKFWLVMTVWIGIVVVSVGWVIPILLGGVAQ